MPTLVKDDAKGPMPAVIERRVSNFKGNLAGGTEDTAAVSGDHDNRITDLTNVTVHEAVAVRTANTGANGHGFAEGVAHTIDGANGQAVGVDFYNGQTTGESAKTLNCAATDKDHTGGVIVTNSNGGDVMPTVGADEYKMTQKQKDTGGGDVLHRKSRMMAANFEMYDMATGGECVSLNARRCVDTMVVEGE